MKIQKALLRLTQSEKSKTIDTVGEGCNYHNPNLESDNYPATARYIPHFIEISQLLGSVSLVNVETGTTC